MIKFKDSINLALDHSLRSNNRLICFGLGVNDPSRFFETTKNMVRTGFLKLQPQKML